MSCKRIGKFKIDLRVAYEAPEIVKSVMGKCVILKADCSAIDSMIEYIALCDDFAEVIDGQIIPNYSVLVDAREGKHVVRFV